MSCYNALEKRVYKNSDIKCNAYFSNISIWLLLSRLSLFSAIFVRNSHYSGLFALYTFACLSRPCNPISYARLFIYIIGPRGI